MYTLNSCFYHIKGWSLLFLFSLPLTTSPPTLSFSSSSPNPLFKKVDPHWEITWLHKTLFTFSFWINKGQSWLSDKHRICDIVNWYEMVQWNEPNTLCQRTSHLTPSDAQLYQPQFQKCWKAYGNCFHNDTPATLQASHMLEAFS